MKSMLAPSLLTKSNRSFLALLLALGLAGAGPARAQDAGSHPLTVGDCVRAALGLNPQLQAYQYDLKASDAAVWAERSALLPQITASGSLFALDGEPVTPFGVLGVTEPELIARNVDFDTGWIATIGLRYPLYQNGSILGFNEAPAVAAARAARKQQEWTRDLAEEDAINTVAETYFNAVTAQSKVDIYGRMVELARQRVVVIQTKAQADLALTQDVQIAEARLRANEAALRASKLKAQQGNAQLAQLMGLTGPVQLKLAGAPTMPSVPPIEELLAGLIEQHPQMGIQNAQVDRARQELRLRQSRRWPAVNFNTSYSYGSDFSGPSPDLFTATVTAEMPVFDFNHNAAAVREARNRLHAEEKRIELARYDIRRDVLDIANELRDIEEEAAGFEEQVLKLQLELRANKAKQDVGLYTPLAVIEAEVALLQEQVLLQDARLKQWVKYAQLQKATGGTWKWIP
jgi:outer membrane protein TolC